MLKIKYILFLIFITKLVFSIDFEFIDQYYTGQQVNFPGHNRSIIIGDSIIYNCAQPGLDIYSYQNEEIQKRSRLLIIQPLLIGKYNNHLYIISHQSIEGKSLYQVNVEDIENPYIENQITSNHSGGFGADICNGVLYLRYHYSSYIETEIYSLPELELITTTEDIPSFIPINDSLAYDKEVGEILIYKFSPFDYTPNLVTTVDFSGIHEYPSSVKIINESYAAMQGHYKISFWNIEDLENWEHINSLDLENQNCGKINAPSYQFYNEYLVIAGIYCCELFDISDINTTTSLHTLRYKWNWMLYFPVNLYHNNGDFITIGDVDELSLIQIEDNTLVRVNSFQEYPTFEHTTRRNNYLYAFDWNGQGNIFDISNPSEPFLVYDLEEPLESNVFGSFMRDNILILIDSPNAKINLYETNGPDIEKIFSIDRNSNRQVLYDYNQNLNTFYFQNQNNIIKSSYENGGFTELFNYSCPNLIRAINAGQYTYLFAGTPPNFRIEVIIGVNENEPHLVNTVEINTNNPNITRRIMLKHNNYLEVILNPSYPRFYSLDNPEDPQLVCQLDKMDSNPGTFIDNYFFTAKSNKSYIYDFDNINSETISAIGEINTYAPILHLYGVEHAGETYLISHEQSGFGVRRLIFTDTNEIEVEPVNYHLTNYPNPFRINTEATTIKYNLPRPAKTKLSLYNIKGQKIKTLINKHQTKGEHTLKWNGRDKFGKKAPNGIYLYKLQMDGETKGVKKCVILK